MLRIAAGAIALLCIAVAPVHADAIEVPVSLRGSPESMVRQNDVARGLGLPFVETVGEMRALANSGQLVNLHGNENYEIADFVRNTEARPEMRTFIERLSAQYHAATGEKLVVTSLTRPTSRQPGNSHELSVHPTGIAVDLRVSQRAQSREWLEGTLLALEERGLLDITRERYPPHYHVAVFPEAYMAYVGELEETRLAAASEMGPRSDAAGTDSAPAAVRSERRDAGAGVALLLLLLMPLAVLGVRRLQGGESE